MVIGMLIITANGTFLENENKIMNHLYYALYPYVNSTQLNSMLITLTIFINIKV